jgi:hypothetical protein
MEHTHFRDDHAEIVKHIAYGYEEGKGRDVFRLSVTNFDTVGATSLLTTVEDLARWDENFYNPKVGGAALVEQQLLRGKLNSGKELDYASGLVHGKYRGLPTVDHGGADAGYRAELLRFPEQHFSVACLCNQAETNPSQLAHKVADVYLADQFKQPPPAHAEPSAKTISMGDERLAQFAGLYWKKDDERTVRLLHEGGKVVLAESDEDHLELTPVADNRLFERVSEFHPTKEQMAKYAGSYMSAEIDPIYRIVIENDNLMLKRLKAKPGKLSAVIPDYFEGPDGTLHFARNAAGDITGFTLDSGRIKNFRFTKMTNADLRR